MESYRYLGHFTLRVNGPLLALRCPCGGGAPSCNLRCTYTVSLLKQWSTTHSALQLKGFTAYCSVRHTHMHDLFSRLPPHTCNHFNVGTNLGQDVTSAAGRCPKVMAAAVYMASATAVTSGLMELSPVAWKRCLFGAALAPEELVSSHGPTDGHCCTPCCSSMPESVSDASSFNSEVMFCRAKGRVVLVEEPKGLL